MRRAVHRLHLGVGRGTGVRIAHHDGNGRAESAALEDAGKDLALVGLLARGDDVALAGAAAVEVWLDVGLGKRQPRRAAINHHANAPAMGFPPGGNAEYFSEVARHKGLKIPHRARGDRGKWGGFSRFGQRVGSSGFHKNRINVVCHCTMQVVSVHSNFRR